MWWHWTHTMHCGAGMSHKSRSSQLDRVWYSARTRSQCSPQQWRSGAGERAGRERPSQNIVANEPEALTFLLLHSERTWLTVSLQCDSKAIRVVDLTWLGVFMGLEGVFVLRMCSEKTLINRAECVLKTRQKQLKPWQRYCYFTALTFISSSMSDTRFSRACFSCVENTMFEVSTVS